MREENQTIIKALNMFGRVPETWELLNEIEILQQENETKTIKLNAIRKYLLNNKLYTFKYDDEELKCLDNIISDLESKGE